MIKGLLGIAIIMGAVVFANYEDVKYEWNMHQLKTELKDIYSQSRHYEKLSRHGVSIPDKKWEELRQRVKSVKNEMEYLRTIKEIENF